MIICTRKLTLFFIVIMAKKGDMMKDVLACLCKMILVLVLCVLVFLSVGCTTQQLGESAADGHRRHLRNMRISNQELMTDIDKVLLLDKPSKLTDKRIP
jgi:hypothetical protein